MVYHRGFCKILEHPIISLPVNQMCYQSDAGVPVHTIRLLLGVAGNPWSLQLRKGILVGLPTLIIKGLS